ncbi:MAG TPA: histidine phosphatase family protein [Candidatus Paceibacterota bacterium]|nr:histidine phosphatase family protein [Candidatus Paceibacterota bacterium]HSA03782.1 histidine phosphatase family protein [Candidatus Paceibacterota bacterium]
MMAIRIGLLRHFPVEHGMPSGWMTAAELRQWQIAYDASAVKVARVDVGDYPWKRCLSSDLHRAYVTAQAAFDGPIDRTPLLREAEPAQFNTGRLCLPIPVWRWLLRLAWMTSHRSQRAARDDFRNRVLQVAELLAKSPEDTLVVSHAGLMIYLRPELVRRGFQGPKFTLPEHVKLYVFEKNPGDQSD